MDLGDIVIHIKVFDANLINPPGYPELIFNLFVMIRSENTFPRSVYQTTIKHHTLNPEWNEDFYIYPKKENPGNIMLSLLSEKGDIITNGKEIKSYVDSYYKFFDKYNLSEEVQKHQIGDHVVFNQDISFDGNQTGKFHFEYDILSRDYTPDQTDTSLDNEDHLKLFIGIINASLVPSQGGVNPSSFVKVCYNDIKYKTTLLENTREPVWNEGFEFNLNEEPKVFKIQICDGKTAYPFAYNTYVDIDGKKSGYGHHSINNQLEYGDKKNGIFQYFTLLFHGDFEKFIQKNNKINYFTNNLDPNTKYTPKIYDNIYINEKWKENIDDINPNENYYLERPIQFCFKGDERDFDWGKNIL